MDANCVDRPLAAVAGSRSGAALDLVRALTFRGYDVVAACGTRPGDLPAGVPTRRLVGVDPRGGDSALLTAVALEERSLSLAAVCVEPASLDPCSAPPVHVAVALALAMASTGGGRLLLAPVSGGRPRPSSALASFAGTVRGAVEDDGVSVTMLIPHEAGPMRAVWERWASNDADGGVPRWVTAALCAATSGCAEVRAPVLTL